MDYDKMSDFDINKRVAEAIGGFPDSNFFEAHEVVFKSRGRFQYTCFDPCNNPADAWPIIVDSRIGIVPGTTNDKWAAHHGDWDICMADENPLRAAMVVFLMMQEG